MRFLFRFITATTMVCVSLIVGVVAVEAGLRLSYDYLPVRIQSIVKHVGKYGASPPVLGPSWFETCLGDKYLAAKNRSDLVAKKVQFGPAIYRVSTSSLGFEDVAFRVQEPNESWDGVIVGDSFGFCHHIDIEHCWVSKLENFLGLKLANLSVPATGSVSHSRYLEKYGRQLNPKIILWQYWVNDTREDVEHVLGGFSPCPKNVDWINNEYENDTLRTWIKNGSVIANLAHDYWTSRHPTVENEENSGVHLFETKTGRKLFAWKNEGPAPNSAVESTGYEMTVGAIGLAARKTKAKGGHFLLIMAPSNLQVYEAELPSEALIAEAQAENRMTDRLIAFAEKNAIEYLDLRDTFITAANDGVELYPYYDVHWTPEGNTVAAEAVHSWLVNKVKKK